MRKFKYQRTRRQEKQEKKARQLAQQRERNRVMELMIAARQARQKVEANMQAAQKHAEEEQQELERIDQFELALKAGDIKMEDIPESLKRKVEKIGKKKVPHTTLEIRHLIRELAGDFTQKEIAKRTGVAQSTISYVLNHEEGRPNHAGRSKNSRRK